AAKIAGYADDFEHILRASAEPAGDLADVKSDDPKTEGELNSGDPAPSVTDLVQPTTIGQSPDVPATQVTQNGGLTRKILGGTTATAIGGTILTWVTGHIDGVAVIAICVTVIVLAIIFRT